MSEYQNNFDIPLILKIGDNKKSFDNLMAKVGVDKLYIDSVICKSTNFIEILVNGHYLVYSLFLQPFEQIELITFITIKLGYIINIVSQKKCNIILIGRGATNA